MAERKKTRTKFEERTPLIVRLPPAQLVFLKKQAAKYGCSQNSEIIRTIALRMEREAAHA